MNTRILKPAYNLAAALSVLSAFSLTTASADTYYWDNDGATPGFGTAAGTWAAPTTGDSTQGWSADSTGSTVPSTYTTTTSDALFFGTGSVGLGSGTITVSGTVEANSLTVGTLSGALTFDGGTIAFGTTNTAPQFRVNNSDNIVNSALRLDASTSVLMGTATALALTLNGSIGGSSNLTFSTPNTSFNNANQVINLGAASTYEGNTTITTGNQNNRLQVNNTSGIANALPGTTVLTLDGGNGTGTGRTLYYDLNSQDQTLAGLRNVTRTRRNQRILGLGLTKECTGTQIITGVNGYTGPTTVRGGKLQWGVGGSSANSTVILDAVAATNSVSITDNTLSWTCAGLTASAAGVLEFDFGSVTPSTSVSPLNIEGMADFSSATPKVHVVTTGIPPGTYPLMTWLFAVGTAPTTADLTIADLAPLTAASLSLSVDGITFKTTLSLEITSTSGTVVKANNTTNLNLGTSWVGGLAPTSSKTAIWDNTVTSANTTVLGDDVTWAGIEILNPAGLVTINAGNTLTLGGASTNINMSAATANLTLNCALALGFDSTWGVQSGRTLTVAGTVSGANALTTADAGTVILSSGANSYSGNTTVGTGSTLKLGAANVIPNGTGNGNLTVDGTLDLNGNSEAINALSGVGIVDTVAGGNPTLTVGVDTSYTNTAGDFSGVIQNSAGSLTLIKTGTNLVALSGINTFSGAVQINEGYLAVGSASAETDVLPNVSSITISNGATLGAWTNTILTKPITVASGGTAEFATVINGTGGTGARDFSLLGGITGNGNVIFKGVQNANAYGHIVVSNCTYTGSTLITCSGELSPGFFPAVQTNNNEIMVRLASDNGLPPTTVVTMDGGNGVGSGVGRYCDLSLNGWNQTLAGLTNVPGRNLRVQRVVNADATNAATLTINNSADYVFSGFLGGTGGALAGSNPGNNFSLTKSGNGTFTISKDDGNTYANGTTINGGTLLVNNTTGSGTGTGDVTVNSGGTLGGAGNISGSVTVNSGGALSPGATGVGTLTTGFLTLQSGSTVLMELDKSNAATNDVLVGTISAGGTLTVANIGPGLQVGDTFTLFSPFSVFNTFAATNLPTGYTWAVDLNNQGTIEVLTVTTPPAPTPTNVTVKAVSGEMVLEWPNGQGWILQSQSNPLSVGLSTNWVDVATTSPYTNAAPAAPAQFYRLIYTNAP